MSDSTFRHRVYVVLQLPRGTKEYNRNYNKEFLENKRYKQDHVVSFDLYIHEGEDEKDCYRTLMSQIGGYKLRTFWYFTVNEDNTIYTPIGKEALETWLFTDPIKVDDKEQVKKLYICTKSAHAPTRSPEMIQKLSTEWGNSCPIFNPETNTMMSQEDILNMIAGSEDMAIHDDDGNPVDLSQIISASQSAMASEASNLP